jgi:hypothetical protein
MKVETHGKRRDEGDAMNAYLEIDAKRFYDAVLSDLVKSMR